jgi:hypothetical protein
MKLKFITPDGLDKNLKATAHKSGKLGFTMDAAEKLKLNAEKSVSVAVNEDDSSDTNLYVVINETVKEGAFKINKAGQYYYVNTKALFDTLKIDYKNDWVVYDISKETIDGQLIYRFKRRERDKKSEKASNV